MLDTCTVTWLYGLLFQYLDPYHFKNPLYLTQPLFRYNFVHAEEEMGEDELQVSFSDNIGQALLRE